MKSWAVRCACIGVFAGLFLSGCGSSKSGSGSGGSGSGGSGSGGSGGSGSVSLTISQPSSPPTIQAGQNVNITAFFSNTGGASESVTWSLTGPGTLTSQTASTVTYNSPSTVSSTTTATVTATLVSDTSITASLKITINPAPSVTVSISNPITTITAGAPAANLSANVQNDPTNSGVNWTLTAGGSACAPTCGALSNMTTTSVTYTPPASVPASPNNAPTITATSVASSSATATDSFTITAATSSTVIVTITNPISTVGAGSAAVTLNASVQNDATNSGVSWTLMAAGGACSPTCGALSNMTTTSVTYTPPTSVPASPDNAPTITATSVASTSASASDPFTITASGTSNNNGLLQGQYAFLVAGYDAAMAASITVDGKGDVTAGEEDYIALTPAITSGDLHATITSGTYLVGSDNRGTITWKDSSGNSFTYTLALGTVSSGIAAAGEMVEFDTNKTEMTGQITLQNPSQLTTSSLSGGYAFEFPGFDGNLNPNASVGSFTVASGNITNGLTDENDAGSVTTSTAFAGSTGSADANGRFTLSLTVGGNAANPIECYILSVSEIDCVGYEGGTAITYGTIEQQSGGPYTTASLSGNTILFEQSETGGSPSYPKSQLGIVNFSGTGNATASFDTYNGSGGLSTSTGTATYAVASAGRVVLTPSGGSNIVFYLYRPNEGFLLDEGSNPGTGRIESQTSGTYSNASLTGNYYFGTVPMAAAPSGSGSSAAAPSLNYSSGVAVADGSGNVTLTVDTNSSGVVTSGTPTTDTYSVASNGRGTLGTNASIPTQTIFYIVSPTKYYYLSVPATTPGNPTIGIGRQ